MSSRERYPYFLRTIPSDVNQAQAMVEIVRMLNWTYVSVVYEESSYGIQVITIILQTGNDNKLHTGNYDYFTL